MVECIGFDKEVLFDKAYITKMKLSILSINIISALALIDNTTDPKHHSLHYFETLHLGSLQHRITKRDVSTDEPSHRQLDYTSHGRRFRLILKRDNSILADDFVAFSVNKDNKHMRIPINHEIYQGYDAYEADTSWASVYYDETGFVFSAVHLSNETFVIEPSKGHLPQSDNYTHIAYKSSDISDNQKKIFCDSSIFQQKLDQVQNILVRRKRESNEPKCAEVIEKKKLCPVLLVADYSFYSNVGQSSMLSTQRILISQMARINKLFEEQVFHDCGSGFGFRIKEIKVLVDYNKWVFNSNNQDITTIDELFQEFARDPNNTKYKNFCAVHLFTARQFSQPVWGKAVVAHPENRSAGICTNWNTGLTNHLDSQSRFLLRQQAMLITAHELGHSWGALHDPDLDKCSPSDSDGGKYLMYMYQGFGFDVNNKVFSSCSTERMSRVLKDRITTFPVCFEEAKQTKCGNFIKEDGEECDEGPEGNSGHCCHANCTLKTTSQCSDVNHACCRDCKINNGTLCRHGGSDLCQNDAYCDGINPDCPKANLPDRTKCRWGICINGTCSSMCLLHNKTHCSCNKVADSCQWCCIHENGKCSPLKSNSSLSNMLPAGAPCIYGICDDKGECIYKPAGKMSGFLAFIQDIQKTPLGDFMKANIVGTILFLSVVLWIPVSMAFHRIDLKNQEKDREQKQWNDPRNHQLVTESDKSRVRKSCKVFRASNQHGI